MAVAPVGGWIAAGGRQGAEPWLLGIAIGLWVAGFDILYACQDFSFDTETGLHSIPVRFGVDTSLNIARFLHILAVAFLVVVGYLMALNVVYFLGVALIGGQGQQ